MHFLWTRETGGSIYFVLSPNGSLNSLTVFQLSNYAITFSPSRNELLCGS